MLPIMRRLRWAVVIVVAFVLLLVQQGMVLHELSHAYYTTQHSGSHLSGGQHGQDTEHCPLCRSFAQVGASVCGADQSLDLPPAARLRVPDRVYSIIGAKAPTARSRGPPKASV